MTPDAGISIEQWRSVAERPTAIPRRDGVIRVAGPGAEACLQGVLTNELVRGTPPLAWGAVLTPKGMIITDLWVRRTADGFLLIVPETGREALLTVLVRSFPPRLARVADLSGELATWWLVGGNNWQIEGVDVAVAVAPAPFDALAIAPRSEGSDRFATRDRAVVDETIGEVLALLGGWPAVGREIDEKTLPQEVRFDELEGVKYDKGCYVGQETVARLHFRGHPNRTMRAMVGSGDLPGDPTVTTEAGKEVGGVATLVSIGNHWVASAKVRREVTSGGVVIVGGRRAELVEFPVMPGAGWA